MVCPFRLSRLLSSCRADPRSFSNSPQAKRKVQRLPRFLSMTCIRPGECAVCQESMRDPCYGDGDRG